VSAVFELRQYTLHPGQRDTLIGMFERLFVDAQEEAGIRVVGQFLDAHDPDRFVWFRGFPDLDSRAAALTRFYDGPVWQTHRNAANATMIDSDDVLLLRPVAGSTFPQSTSPAAMPLHVTILPFDESLLSLEAITLLRTEPAKNNYPRLPVRENENVIVAVTRDEVRHTVAPLQRMKLIPTAHSNLR